MLRDILCLQTTQLDRKSVSDAEFGDPTTYKWFTLVILGLVLFTNIGGLTKRRKNVVMDVLSGQELVIQRVWAPWGTYARYIWFI